MEKNNVITRTEEGRVIFTEQMKKDYTILLPNMLPIHFKLLRNTLINEGYHAELLETTHRGIVEEGLKNVHNDTCYPALLVIGQMIDALKSGKYDPDKVALLITQTGGGCRASNYIHLLRKALIKSGYDNVPVVSLNLTGLEKNPGFKISFRLIQKFFYCLLYGDLLMLLKNQCKPYERFKGQTDALIEKWIETLTKQLEIGDGLNKKSVSQNIDDILADFARLARVRQKKIKVGIVGEIYVKFSPLGNNNLEELLLSEDVETVVPGVMDFVIYSTDVVLSDFTLYGGSILKNMTAKFLKDFCVETQRVMINKIVEQGVFIPPSDFEHLKSMAKGYVGYGNKMGEGWLLIAEMLELVTSGVTNIVCTQPFGCLPNHIVGKGMIKKIRENHPMANIIPVDYDSGAAEINQENRIKLMVLNGKRALSEAEGSNPTENDKKQTVAAGL